MIINIRGTNGSGKSTLARHFIDMNAPVDLCWYDKKTKEPADQAAINAKGLSALKCIDGYGKHHLCANGVQVDVVVVGSYKTMAGGMDTIPTTALQRAAIHKATTIGDHVLCEGILPSTVYGSWADFARAQRDQFGHTFVFAYLQTPVDECLRRIRGRQEASGKVRPIKDLLVRDKVRAISQTRAKAIREGFPVYDLPNDSPAVAVELILQGKGEAFRATR